MPPKNELQPQRRDRKHALQEDFIAALKELKKSTASATEKDEKIFPILREALDEEVDPNIEFESKEFPLCLFAHFGMIKCFEECIMRGADPTKYSNSADSDILYGNALSCALNPRNVSSTLLLEHPKADRLRFESRFLTALEYGFIKVVEKIVRKRPNIAPAVLRKAMYQGNEEMVEFIFAHCGDSLKQELKQEILDEYLLDAVRINSTKLCKLFLDKGANVEATNKNGETPFLVATKHASIDCMKLLIERHCDLFKTNNENLYAEDIAIRYDKPKSLKFLVEETEVAEVVDWLVQLVPKIIASNTIECFKALLSKREVPSQIVRPLVVQNRYEMLSFILLECQIERLSIELLQDILKDCKNEEIVKLINVKIEMMTTELPKVKKEAEVETD